jgi:tetratricopeptide (TPR) repeat protein
VIRLYDPSANRPLASDWGQDWGLVARTYASATLAALGHLDRARRLYRETIALAREGDPFGLAVALSNAPIHLPLEEGLECADEAIAIAAERGYPWITALANLFRGHARGGLQGLEEVREGAALAAALGPAYVPLAQRLLAEVNCELGRTDDALAALETAAASRGEIANEDGPLQRVRGDILMQREGAEEAELCFRRALEIAQDQSAKSYELQAATSLARLLRDQGRRDDARALLQPVYDWFTEGFDTADLRDAKALLGEL